MQSKDGRSSISRTKTGAYRIRFYDEGGNRRSINASTATEKDFIARAIRRRDPLDQWFPPEATVVPIMKKRTFADLTAQFLEHRRSVKEVSDSCLWNYEAQLNNHILPVLGQIKLEDLHLTDIEKLAAKLKVTKPKTKSYALVRRELYESDEFLSASYRKEILTLACSIAKFGYLRDYMPNHPFKAFEMPDAGDKPYDYWRMEEEDAFLDWLSSGGIYYLPHGTKKGEKKLRKWRVWNHQKVYDVILFTLRTGLRKGEVSGLAMEDVDFDLNLITVHSTWSFKEGKEKETTKNGSFRRVEMNQDVRQILSKYRDEPGSFRPFEVIMRSHTMKKFSKLAKYAQVREIHFHALRHTFLTNIANGIGMDAPVDILKVMELAGHKDIQTTMIYVHGAGIKDTSSRQWSREERKRRGRMDQLEERKEA